MYVSLYDDRLRVYSLHTYCHALVMFGTCNDVLHVRIDDGMYADVQTFLRGRMGHSFYHSMGFLDLVANSADEYVDIAVKLGLDRQYRHRCSTIIKHLSPVLWQRQEVCASGCVFV